MVKTKLIAAAVTGALLFVAGCGKKVEDTVDKSMPIVTQASLAADSSSLTFRLADMKEKMSAGMPEEVREIVRHHRESLVAAGILDSALNVGDDAPSFSLTNAVGETVESEHLLTNGPIVLTFYRGHW